MPWTPYVFFEHGRFWTGESGQPWADTLVASDGRVFAVGSRDELGWLRARAQRVVDLGDHLVLPGFNDAHVHAFEGGKSLLEIDLRAAKSLADFKQRVKSYADGLPPGQWITGGNWDHQNWDGDSYPTRQLLDECAPAHPALLFRVDWHVAVANSLALRAAGIDRNTPDPPGGEIERDAHGEPTGILKDAAAEMVLARVPEPDEARLRDILRAATREAARLGVTSYQDNVSVRQLRAYQRMLRDGQLKVRVSCWLPLSALDQLAELGIERSFGSNWLQVGTIKLFTDGSLGAGTAYFFQPYLDRPDYRGLLIMPERKLEEALRKIQQAGLQAAVHAIGDAANALVLDVLEQLGVKRADRHRIEHVQTLRDADVRRLASLGVVASVQPVHALDDLRWAHRKIGERVRDSYRLGSLVRAGAPVAIGTDWPVASLNPMLGLQAAIERPVVADGGNRVVPGNDETISLEQAVRLYTLGSAYAQGREAQKGTLALGKLADFVVLDRDIFESKAEELPETKVLMTVVGGEIVYEN